MVALALFPPVWRRVMEPRVLDHYHGDIRLAALRPRQQKRIGYATAASAAQRG